MYVRKSVGEHIHVACWDALRRTSHLAERAFEEERRRTTVLPHLGDEASVVKLGFAVLIRISERCGSR